MTVYSFLNGASSTYAPEGQSDTWGNYSSPDTLRVQALTMQSWENCGWRVVRYGVSDKCKGFGEFQSPILRKSVGQGYGMKYWNNWFAMEEIFCRFKTENGFHWFTTQDVFNDSFIPEIATTCEMTAKRRSKDIITLENFRHSHSVFACNLNYVLKIQNLIRAVDRGELNPDTSINLVSDESIARDLFWHEKSLRYPICTVGEKPIEGFHLRHIARSTLYRLDERFTYLEL